MKRQRKQTRPPDRLIRVRQYEHLRSFLNAFAEGYINLLILIGGPGLAKSRTVRSIVRDGCWIEGNASPFGMFLKLYKERDRLVVIDDVDSLYADRHGVRLLKCLCQTEREKTVAWPSAARDLQREGVPREFTTQSRVAIITNEWKTVNRNVAALQDRGHTILFQPNVSEVHAQVSEWFTDGEILSWFGERLHLIPEPSMRHYVRAVELKKAGIDWRPTVPVAPDNRRQRLVLDLLEDRTYESQEARVREFTRRGGGCRATYFNHLKALRNKGVAESALEL